MSTVPRAFIIGHPVAHSRSPLIHGHWLRRFGLLGSYEKVDLKPAEVAGFLEAMRESDFVGGNVTVPHKTAVLSLVDEVEDAARIIGAANTLWFDGQTIVATNTDVLGFLASLDEEAPGWDGDPGLAVVLGAGGAARAVAYGLRKRGFTIAIVNRSRGPAEVLAAEFGAAVRVVPSAEIDAALADATLLVNTTSLGMEGQPSLALDIGALRSRALVVDVVYVPLVTPLLRDAAARGHRTVGGLGMLLHQAVPGFTRWFGVAPRVDPSLRAIVEADVRGR